MKKILNIIASLGIVASSSTLVVACSSRKATKKSEIKLVKATIGKDLKTVALTSTSVFNTDIKAEDIVISGANTDGINGRTVSNLKLENNSKSLSFSLPRSLVRNYDENVKVSINNSSFESNSILLKIYTGPVSMWMSKATLNSEGNLIHLKGYGVSRISSISELKLFAYGNIDESKYLNSIQSISKDLSNIYISLKNGLPHAYYSIKWTPHNSNEPWGTGIKWDATFNWNPVSFEKFNMNKSRNEITLYGSGFNEITNKNQFMLDYQGAPDEKWDSSMISNFEVDSDRKMIVTFSKPLAAGSEHNLDWKYLPEARIVAMPFVVPEEKRVTLFKDGVLSFDDQSFTLEGYNLDKITSAGQLTIVEDTSKKIYKFTNLVKNSEENVTVTLPEKISDYGSYSINFNDPDYGSYKIGSFTIAKPIVKPKISSVTYTKSIYGISPKVSVTGDAGLVYFNNKLDSLKIIGQNGKQADDKITSVVFGNYMNGPELDIYLEKELASGSYMLEMTLSDGSKMQENFNV